MSIRKDYLFNIRFQSKIKHDGYELCDLVVGKSNVWLNSIHYIETEDNDILDRAIRKLFKIFHTIEFEFNNFKFAINIEEWDWVETEIIKRSDEQCVLSKITRGYLYESYKILRYEAIERFDLKDDENDIEYYIRKLVLYDIDDVLRNIILLSNRIGD